MKIHVGVPATTANLGPGFDTLGLGLNLWNEAEFSLREDGKIVVAVAGEGCGKLPVDATNFVAESALGIYQRVGETCPGLEIRCVNRVPLSSGLGSSSAAMLTGMLGANALLGHPFTDEAILRMAIEDEGHPDNLAPAMLGGLVASIVHGERVIAVRLPAQANRGMIYITVVLPDFEFPTRHARSILPKMIARQDAINNISGAVLVTEALRTGNPDLLGIAMQDKLHQPYRLPLIPGAVAALEAGKEAGAAAVALSGAGPGLIAFSSELDQNIGLAMQQVFAANGLAARIFALEMSYKGAEVTIV